MTAEPAAMSRVLRAGKHMSHLRCTCCRISNDACAGIQRIDKRGHTVSSHEKHVLASALHNDRENSCSGVTASEITVVVVGCDLAGKTAERRLRHCGGRAPRHGEHVLFAAEKMRQGGTGAEEEIKSRIGAFHLVVVCGGRSLSLQTEGIDLRPLGHEHGEGVVKLEFKRRGLYSASDESVVVIQQRIGRPRLVANHVDKR
jgi:hypothetical protein